MKKHALRAIDAQVRHETDLIPQPQFYFANNTAYFKPRRVTCTPSNQEPIPFGQLRAVYLEIEEGELVGEAKLIVMNVKLLENSVETGCFTIASNGRIKIPIKADIECFELVLRNGENHAEMWPPFKFILNKA